MNKCVGLQVVGVSEDSDKEVLRGNLERISQSASEARYQQENNYIRKLTCK